MAWICSVLFSEFLGITYQIKTQNNETILIQREGKKIELPTDFFDRAKFEWLTQDSMPIEPLTYCDLALTGLKTSSASQSVPILFGNQDVEICEHTIKLGLDIFGSVFFMLSRYEELVTLERDEHNRFPATASIAHRAGFLNRPIVDEYVEILWACLHSLWPDLKRKKNNPSNFITCDVDWPLNPTLYSVKSAIRSAGSALLKEKSILKTIHVTSQYLLKKFGFNVKDNYREAINWMMDVNEQVGNKVAFYFITHNTSKLDTNLDFNSVEMRQLFKEIHRRGHEIGIHPGYKTFNNPENFSKTVFEFKRILQEESIEQQTFGGRQHFLMWDSALTPHLWEQHEFDYDSTLSFADKAGFRCGTSHEFTMYDLINRSPFKLKQRPLIVMECSIIASRYENLGYSDEAMERFMYFKKTCHRYSGNFTLLWHNSHLTTANDKIFYMEMIK